MPITITQLVLSLFLLFALSRVFLRFRGGNLSLFGFLFWSGLFSSAIVVVLAPKLTSTIAIILGIGRGADAIVYSSIVILFYLVFRLYVYLQDVRHDISNLVKEIALKEARKNAKKSPRH